MGLQHIDMLMNLESEAANDLPGEMGGQPTTNNFVGGSDARGV
jgi:hypothetical protein